MTAVQVTFPLSGQQAVTTSVVIHQAEYMHELATVELPYLQAGADFITGAPVHVLWVDAAKHFNEWYGYIDTINQRNSPTGQSSSAICVGATWPLKEQRQDVWTNVTGDGVAESMAARWRLGLDVDPSARVWPILPQAGVSDWTLLASMAHDIGFTLYSRGVILCFHARTRELTRLTDAAPVFIYTPLDTTSSIITFQPTASDSINAGPRGQISTMDSNGVPVTITNDDGAGSLLASIDRQPTFTTVNSRPVSTVSEAQSTIAAQTEDQRFSIRARARVRGDARLHPAMPVYLGGLPTQWNGTWFVLSVEHVMANQSDATPNRDVYYCDLLLGRDGMGVSNYFPSASDVHHTDIATAEIGPNGLWQCGPLPQPVMEDTTPAFVMERLARLG